MSDTKRILVWLRRDLRLQDNPALSEAAKHGEVIPVFIWSPEEEGDRAPGEASQWYLHHSLKSLQAGFENLGAKLIIRCGNTSLSVLEELVKDCNADAVYWGRQYSPHQIARDTEIKSALMERGVEVKSFNSSLLFEPWQIESKTGSPYKVFTPFWKECRRNEDLIEAIYSLPSRSSFSTDSVKSTGIDDLGLLPRIPWDKEFYNEWQPGEKGAWKFLETFLDTAVDEYSERRNNPDVRGTSRLSPALHFGEISPKQIFVTVMKRVAARGGEETKGERVFLSEVGWREFNRNLVYHFPETVTENLKRQFDSFPWEDNPLAFDAWKKGQTGYPIVDAGMRELWATGWMHNRVRMIVASFLIKDLFIHWKEGERWFWDTLVDADTPNNVQGWQWTAGTGADASPYFRVFNPMLQGAKFDKNGDYIRKWVPEIKLLPNKFLNTPWEAPLLVLQEAGIELGVDYPSPIVKHSEMREKALAAYKSLSSPS